MLTWTGVSREGRADSETIGEQLDEQGEVAAWHSLQVEMRQVRAPTPGQGLWVPACLQFQRREHLAFSPAFRMWAKAEGGVVGLNTVDVNTGSDAVTIPSPSPSA